MGNRQWAMGRRTGAGKWSSPQYNGTLRPALAPIFSECPAQASKRTATWSCGTRQWTWRSWCTDSATRSRRAGFLRSGVNCVVRRGRFPRTSRRVTGDEAAETTCGSFRSLMVPCVNCRLACCSSGGSKVATNRSWTRFCPAPTKSAECSPSCVGRSRTRPQDRDARPCPLPVAHCPLPIAHCPLPTAHCPLPIAHCLLPILDSLPQHLQRHRHLAQWCRNLSTG